MRTAPRLLTACLLAVALAAPGCSTDSEEAGWGLGDDAGQDASDTTEMISPDTGEPDVVEDDANDVEPSPDADTGRDVDGGPEICGDGDDEDRDRDGLLDCEEEMLGTAIDDADTDGDGLDDHAELLNRTSPIDADTDGDGLEDGFEVEIGLDPNLSCTYPERDDIDLVSSNISANDCDADLWMARVCDDPKAEPTSFHRSPSVTADDGSSVDKGNWHLALPQGFDNYTDVNVATNGSRDAAAVYSDSSSGVAGAIVSQTPSASHSSPRAIIDAHVQQMATVATVEEESTPPRFHTHEFYEGIRGNYVVTAAQPSSAEALRNDLLFALAPFDRAETSGLPQAAGDETHTRFVVFLSVIDREYDSGERHALTTMAVVPEATHEASEQIRHTVRDLTNTTNVAENSFEHNVGCRVIPPQYRHRVDMYWVLHPSPTMGEHLPKVRSAAEEWFQLAGSAVDLRMGITSTSYNDGRIGYPAAWQDALDGFNRRLDQIVPTSARYPSRGLEAAKKGLQHMLREGSMAPSVYEKIRPRTQVVTIFVTDDEDERFADAPLSSPQGSALMDDYADFFSERSTVFSFVGDGAGCGVADGASYRQLAQATGGEASSLCADDFNDQLSDMIVTGAHSPLPYQLGSVPISSTIRVWIDGEPVPRSNEDGFMYAHWDNALRILGSYRPEPPEDGEVPPAIAVSYETFGQGTP